MLELQELMCPYVLGLVWEQEKDKHLKPKAYEMELSGLPVSAEESSLNICGKDMHRYQDPKEIQINIHTAWATPAKPEGQSRSQAALENEIWQSEGATDY